MNTNSLLVCHAMCGAQKGRGALTWALSSLDGDSSLYTAQYRLVKILFSHGAVFTAQVSHGGLAVCARAGPCCPPRGAGGRSQGKKSFHVGAAKPECHQCAGAGCVGGAANVGGS